MKILVEGGMAPRVSLNKGKQHLRDLRGGEGVL